MTEYECREAARFVLVAWTDWLKLDPAERALAVAHYRLHNAVESNVADAQSQYLESQRRRESRRGRR